jgi:cysteine-S-conjugate beta-lyase
MNLSADFDRDVDRRGSRSVKWGGAEQAAGRGLLPMSVADLDFLAPPAVVTALERQASLGSYGYSNRGARFYDAIERWLERRHTWRIDRSWVCPCPGVTPALHGAIRAMSRPGQGVVVQTPVYYPFFSAVTDNDRRLLDSPLREGKTGWEINFDDLDRKLARARILLLCNPHNPVGRVWRHEELAEIGRLCESHDVAIISDDIHADLSFSQYTPIARDDAALARRVITVLSPSKAFGLSALHTAYCVIANDVARRAFEREMRRMGYFWGNIFGDTALQTAYLECESWLDSLLGYLRRNRTAVQDAFGDHSGIRSMPIEGTYLAWLDFRGTGLSEEEVSRILLDEARVELERGSIFGAVGSGFQRLNFATQAPVLSEGLKRIRQAFAAWDGRGSRG